MAPGSRKRFWRSGVSPLAKSLKKEIFLFRRSREATGMSLPPKGFPKRTQKRNRAREKKNDG